MITKTLKLLLKSCWSTATLLPVVRDFKPMLPWCCFSNSELLPCHGATHSPCVNMSAAVPLELPLSTPQSSPIHQRLSQHYMLFHPIFHCTVHKCCYNFMDNICSDASSHVAVIGVSRSGKWLRFTGCSTSHCREKYVFFLLRGF